MARAVGPFIMLPVSSLLLMVWTADPSTAQPWYPDTDHLLGPPFDHLPNLPHQVPGGEVPEPAHDQPPALELSFAYTLILQVASDVAQQTDLLGIGVAWTRPSDARFDEETLLEVFYRIQLTARVQVTPDIQVIFDPAQSPEGDAVTVFGTRLQANFWR